MVNKKDQTRKDRRDGLIPLAAQAAAIEVPRIIYPPIHAAVLCSTIHRLFTAIIICVAVDPSPAPSCLSSPGSPLLLQAKPQILVVFASSLPPERLDLDLALNYY